MSAPVCSRRVSAGITPAPGTTSRLPVWWGRADWLQVEVAGALREHRDVCRAHHVAPDTVQKVAEGMAEFADSRTGRQCRPTNERLVEVAQCSLSTVQRARRVLKELGLVVEVTAGRSVLTLAERLAAWERGSSHRAIAAEFALCSRGRRRPVAVENPPAAASPVDRDTPPVGRVVGTSVQRDRGPSQSQTEMMKAAPRPAHTEKRRRRPVTELDPGPRRLAEEVRWALPWLRDVHVRRLVPLLTPFSAAGWGRQDVVRTVADVLAARGSWRVPDNLRSPAGYLATLLKDVDPLDRPGALDEAMAADLRRRWLEDNAYRRQLIYGAPCPHGTPAGDVPSPLRGSLACPSCRAASQP